MRLDLGVAGSASLAGPVVFGRRADGPVRGDLRLPWALDQSSEAGELNGSIALPGVALRGRAAVTVAFRRITASGGVSGWVRGLRSANGRAVVSERGVAAFSDVCVRPGTRCRARTALGLVAGWSGSLPQWVGADAGGSVTGRHALLLADATGRAGGARPRLRLRSPSGRIFDTAKARAGMTVVRDAARRYLGVTVVSPERGRWRVLGAGSGSPRVRLLAVRRMTRVRAGSPRPASTRGRPLRRGRGVVAIRWSSRGLPAGTSVDVYASPDVQGRGRRVARGLAPRGGVRIPTRSLTKGRNRITLVIRRGATVLDEAPVARRIWLR